MDECNGERRALLHSETSYMALALLSIAFGLALLVWSADRFVEGSASTARHFGMPPLLIGMVIVNTGIYK